MRTKPFKSKGTHYNHSTDISEKEVYEVSLVPFQGTNGKTLVNLTISARNSHAGSSLIIVLHPSQIVILKKVISEYEAKQINPISEVNDPEFQEFPLIS